VTSETAGKLPPQTGSVLVISALLATIGLVMVYSATAPFALGEFVPPHFVRQLIGLVMGSALAFVASRLSPEHWRRIALPMWGVAVAMLVLVPLVGDKVNGSRRWLTLPGLGFQFQPSEFARWVTLVAVVSMLAGREQISRRASAAPLGALALAAIPAGLIFIEPDTGSAVVLLGLVAILLFVAGTPLRIFAVPGALLGAALAIAIQFRPYVADRILAFRDPWAHADDQGFQLVQSFVAFARGGLFGVGLGDGRQKLYYLPEAHTDFVLSVLAEELGLFGVAIVIGAFAALLIAGCRIALRSRDRFNFLMAAGMTALLTVPAALNGAVVMGLVPPKGIAMPFLSYGRTSLLVSFVAVGTLLGIARREAKNHDANTQTPLTRVGERPSGRERGHRADGRKAGSRNSWNSWTP
jgi:cell division protein FtsW